MKIIEATLAWSIRSIIVNHPLKSSSEIKYECFWFGKALSRPSPDIGIACEVGAAF